MSSNCFLFLYFFFVRLFRLNWLFQTRLSLIMSHFVDPFILMLAFYCLFLHFWSNSLLIILNFANQFHLLYLIWSRFLNIIVGNIISIVSNLIFIIINNFFKHNLLFLYLIYALFNQFLIINFRIFVLSLYWFWVLLRLSIFCLVGQVVFGSLLLP